MPKTNVLFESSATAVAQIERAHDFFGGSLVALQNLSWQVRGFRDAYPHLTQAQVVARFAEGFTSGGTNALTLVTERRWQEQEHLLAELRLINGISIYESWCESFLVETGTRAVGPKKLQFPANVAIVAARLGRGPDSSMQPVRANLELTKMHRPHALNELLICFRAFKEARNCLAHGGGLADGKAELAWASYEAIAGAWQSAGVMRSRPELPEIKEGEPVVLTTRGVIGFVASLQVLLTTLDGIAAGSCGAIDYVTARWTSGALPRLDLAGIGRSSDQALARFVKRWRLLGLPSVAGSARELYATFQALGIL